MFAKAKLNIDWRQEMYIGIKGRMEGRISIVFRLVILLLFSVGCSSHGGGVLPDEGASGSSPQMMLQQTYRWTWDSGLYYVSEDHSSIERISDRSADLHFNVTPFVEPPNCSDCLIIGKPHVQLDGTIKVKVMLTHPFFGAPQYTGFDVRGTIMFPSTRNLELDKPLWGIKDVGGGYYWPSELLDHIPLRFSRAEDGGGQLLNQDGYTFYLHPGLYLGPEYEQPIFNYSKGTHAIGPDPDSTVNGFKLFTDDPERRMFRVNDLFVRTYHIDPPDGEFIFGYVVDACWAPPTNTPVTDPATDFPFWANCEDGYVLEWEQTAPFKTGDFGGEYYELGKLKYLTRPDEVGLIPTSVVHGFLLCPDIAMVPEHSYNKDVVALIKPNGDEHPQYLGEGVFKSTYSVRSSGEFIAPPGEYLALAIATLHNYPDACPVDPYYPQHLFVPLLVDFITLEVVEGD